MKAAVAFALMLAALPMLGAACGGGEAPVAGQTPQLDTRLNVVTTIYPITYFAERVGGERVNVRSLVAAGVEAHDFEPKPSDLRLIHEADVVLYAHRLFEAWMADAVGSVDDSVFVAAVVPLPPVGDGPEASAAVHTWLSPSSAGRIVSEIESVLVEADPVGAEAYRANATAVHEELQSLAAGFRAGLSECRLDTFFVSHAAFGALAVEFGLQQVALTGQGVEADSSGKRVSEIVSLMRDLDAQVVLVEPILSDELARTVAAEAGAALLPLHPLEALTTAEVAAGSGYFDIMRANLVSLQSALDCAVLPASGK